MKVEFVISAVPVAQPRQRHSVVVDEDDKVKRDEYNRVVMRNYIDNDHPVNHYKYVARHAATEAMAAQGQQKAEAGECVFLRAIFFMPRPTFCNDEVGRAPNKEPKYGTFGPIFDPKRPDLDNLMKSLWDAVRGVVWDDDSQVCHTETMKLYHGKDEQPRVEVLIETFMGNPAGRVLK